MDLVTVLCMTNTVEPNVTINKEGNTVYEAPENAYKDEMTFHQKVVVGVSRIGKVAAAFSLAAELTGLNVAPIVISISTYFCCSALSSSMTNIAKQDANDKVSPFPKQVAKVNLAREFLKELNPLKGFKEVIQQRDIRQLGL